MAFSITRVGYRDFRNMHEFVLEPGPRLTILVGANAVGKTNCVEGVQILTAGASFRHLSPADLIRRTAERAQLRLYAEGEKRTLDVTYDIFPTKKLLSINGKRRPNSEGRGILPSILFYPDELQVVKGGAAERRELIDGFGVQLNAAYAKLSSDYRRAMIQRNSLLKDAARTGTPVDAGMFEAWTEALISAGSMLYLYRTALLGRLAPHIAEAYAGLAAGEEATVAYQSAYGLGREAETGVESSTDAVFAVGGEAPTRSEVEQRLRARLAEVYHDEVRRCQTLAGPHLDDVMLSIGGLPARSFGSQGQQRTLVLAIKLAQVALVHEMKGQYPVFLLDDVMSELDSQRRARLFDLVQGGMQTIVTTTNLEYFRDEELAEAKVVRLGTL